MLSGTAAAHASELLHAALLNRSTEKQAYPLLGRLRSAGWPTPLGARSLLDRLRLAFAIRRAAQSAARTLRLETVRPALLGSLLGVALFAGLLALTGLPPDSTSLLVMLTAAIILTPSTAFAASQGSQPLNVQFDRLAAASSETIVARST